MARQIEAYKLRTELAVDASKGSAAMKAFQKDVEGVGASVKKLGPQIDEAGKKAGKKFGERFGGAATAMIEGSFDQLGKTLGSVLGTAIMPGLGTIVGSTVGDMADKAASALTPLIAKGMRLNEIIEDTRIEFTTFTGSAKEADKYLGDLQKTAIETGTSFGFLIETNERLYDLTGNLKLSTTILKAATDQAANFGGSAETITKIANALGLVAEKGDLAQRDLKALYRLGIDAPRLLAEATGRSQKEIKKLIAQGRIRGDVAARVISEGIERETGGFAAKLARTSASGKRRQAETVQEIAAAKGTVNLTAKMGEYYQAQTKFLSSDTANAFVEYLNAATGKLIEMTQRGIESGIQLSKSVTEGFSGTDAIKAIGDSINSFGQSFLSEWASWWIIKSPSQVMIEASKPLGEGIWQGVKEGFVKGKTKDKDLLRETLELLLRDPKIQALLETIRIAEGGAPGKIVGHGGTVTDLSRHPNKVGLVTAAGPSTAAGNYQETYTNWKTFAPLIGAEDFGVKNQQLVALLIMLQKAKAEAGTLDPKRLQALMSGSPGAMMGLAGRDWTSTAGSTLGGGKHWSEKQWLGTLAGQFDRFSVPGTGTGGAPSRGTLIGRMAPQQTVGADPIGSDSFLTRGGPGFTFSFDPEQFRHFNTELEDNKKKVFDLDKALTNFKTTGATTTQTVGALTTTTGTSTEAVQGLADAQQAYTDQTIKNTEATRKVVDEEIVRGEDMRNKLAGILGQVAGQIPSQEVGKKRGLFSKILGIAAPFLNFIPGVGPILATIAGAAAQGIGGNWGGAVSTIGGGFATGGAFNPNKDDEGEGSSSSSTGATSGGLTLAPGMTLFKPGHRAGGGPVYAGASYVVGERGSELFTPASDGRITSHAALAGSSPVPVEVTNWQDAAGGGSGEPNKAVNFLTGGLAGVALGKRGKSFAAGGLFGALLHRARGGPVYQGQSYIVGERQAEVFTPNSDGYISPGVGGSSGAGSILAAAAELRAAVQHLQSMPATHVVMRGARGLVRAMDHDAGLIRLVSQRQRLA